MTPSINSFIDIKPAGIPVFRQERMSSGRKRMVLLPEDDKSRINLTIEKKGN